METDERFKDLAKDPRFKTLKKKRNKIQIDDRFKSMFNDEKFTFKSRDKRGDKLRKPPGNNLKKFYSLEGDDGDNLRRKKGEKKKDVKSGEEEEQEVEVEEEVAEADEVEEVVDENEEADSTKDGTSTEVEGDSDEEDAEPEIDDASSEVSSSSDEEDDSEVEELDPEKIQYDWKPLDADAETCEDATRRLAIQNLDWDHLDVRDIFTLLNSIRPPLSVKIYVSEFGKSRLKDEELEGPKELKELGQVDAVEEEYELLKEKMKFIEKSHRDTYKINEYEDADEGMNLKDEKVRELVRKYQLNRMRYFYAIAEFDSAESAEIVYKELDGMEYEGSSMELDLRFVPDDVEFDAEDVKAKCNKLPDLTTYKVPQFINSALQQTTVKFTWDETDSKRQEKLRKAYTKEELEKDDLDAYLATDSDEEDEYDSCDDNGDNDAMSTVTANTEARANKYKLLLQSLEEEQEAKKKVDVDVEWGDFSEDDAKEQEDVEEDEEVDSQPESEESVESVPERMKKLKKKRPKKRKRDELEAGKDDGELDLLVMDTADKTNSEFRFDPNDPRFKAVYDSGLYNIDPSHPNFKRTEAFDMMAENKRARRQKQ